MSSEKTGSRDRLLLLNRDLMSGIPIVNTAAKLGLKVDRVSSESELVQRMSSAGLLTALVVIDMNLPVDWEVIAPALENPVAKLPVIGFGPHVDIEGRRAAKSAGLTRIYSNGDFHKGMGEIIARYAGVEMAGDSS